MTQFPYGNKSSFSCRKKPRYVARAGYLYIARLGHNNPFGIFYPNWAIGPNLFNSIYSVYCQPADYAKSSKRDFKDLTFDTNQVT